MKKFLTLMLAAMMLEPGFLCKRRGNHRPRDVDLPLLYR